MAKKVYAEEINKKTDWGGDESTNNLPVSGARVQEFIKKSLDEKMGVFYYDSANNRYLVFADSESRDLYIQDPVNNHDLLLGNFDAPFNYTANINLLTPNYVSVLSGAVGNEISFTFDVVNKQGASVGDDIVCTYTFMRGATKKQVSARYRNGSTVTMNIDKYLADGTNTVIIGIVGENTLAATTISITYQVVNLSISSDFNISNVYDLRNNPNLICEVPFKVSGTGIKTVEWYIDGEKLEKDIYTDEVTQGESERTKYINLSNFQQGVHTLQLRGYVTINDEKFYSKTLYYEFMVYTGADRNSMVAMSAVLPIGKIIETGTDPEFYATQYENFDIEIASFNPTGSATTNVEVIFNDIVTQTLQTIQGEKYKVSIPLSDSGTFKFALKCGTFLGEKTLQISPSTLAIEEITNELEFYLTAAEKSNAASDKAIWKYGNYRTVFEGFDWTEENGWKDGALVIPNGSSASINYSPLAINSVLKGKTIEIEIGSKDVLDDDVVLLDLMTKSGDDTETGILITASEAKIKSTGKKEVSTKFKSEEIYRIAFVINKNQGVTDKGLAYIYVNGILCGAVNYDSTDDFMSSSQMVFKGSSKASVLLRSIRVYNTALSASQLINNYALYQSSPTERISIVKRNDVLDEETGVLSYEKLANQLPVLIITGDIPTLEATTDKKTSIIAQVQYINNQNPSYSFTATNMKITPQGTSSMSYPKKNYKLYTTEDYTKIYNSAGKEIKDKLYSFKPDAIPVNVWCLKADYAESSSTHNTGIARLWNDVLKNAKINGEYVFRTEAQKKAIEEGYLYDVRTTVDGFPIVVFYRLDEDSDLIFLGKYNFNNDKSTENVYGFRDIPGFDNTNMQCWEVLNNGNDLALFKTAENFDENWSEAYESRYPDVKNPDTTNLKAFSEWMSTVSQEDFATQKWEHLDIYKVAAYYIYFIRFGAVDQTVKNAMFTSEDGKKFYFINYDNDTINALRNDGLLVFPPDITRESLDSTYSIDVYCYAGHDSRLWNMLEADPEFMNTIVPATDNALYEAGLTYKNVIDMFDVKQSSQWCERVYNEDSQYKYIQPYTINGTNNLPMLQGDRKAHRQWWLSKRFAIYDAKWVTGEYKSGCFEFKCATGTPAGMSIGIVSGYPLSYGYGINNVPQEKGIELKEGQSYSFIVNTKLNIGDPVRIYAAYYIQSFDLSEFAEWITYIDLKQVKSATLGTKLEKLIIGKTGITNTSVTDINGLVNATKLTYIDIQGFAGLTSLNLSTLKKLNTLKAFNSGLTSVEFAKGAPVSTIELPTTVQAIVLNNHPLTYNSIKIGEDNDWTKVRTLKISGCPNLGSDFNKVWDWYFNKTTEDKYCTLELDNVVWKVTPEQLINLGQLAVNGGTLKLKGKITLVDFNEETIESNLNTIKEIFGEFVFNKESELYIYVPDSIFLVGPTNIVEGATYQYEATVFSENKGTVVYSIISGSTSGLTLNSETGELKVALNNGYNRNITIRALHTPTSGAKVAVDKQVYIKNETYPSLSTINGSLKLNNDYQVYTLVYSASSSSSPVTGKYHIEWSLTGDLANYAEIIDSSESDCTLHITQVATQIVSGTLTAKVIKDWNNSQYSSTNKTIQMLSDNILMTSTTNPEIMAIMYKAGLAANSTYMTKEEAAAVTELDLVPGGNTSSIFYNCFGYKENIYFEEFQAFTGLTEIPDYCFYNSWIKKISLPSQITKIGSYAFYQNNVSSDSYILEELIIPPSVTSMGYSACRCETLTVNNPTSLTGGSYLKLKNLNILSDLKGYFQLDNMQNLASPSQYNLWLNYQLVEELIVPEGVTEIKDYTFYYSPLNVKKIVLPESVISIGKDNFYYMPLLEEVELGDKIDSLAGYSFYSCKKLRRIKLSSSMTKFGNDYKYNFRYLPALEELHFTDITNWVQYGFQYTDYPQYDLYLNDKKVTDLTISSSMKFDKPEYILYGCKSVERVMVDENNPYYDSRDNCNAIIEKSTNTLLRAFKYTSISESVTAIGDRAYNNQSLTSITLPNSVTSIGNSCFSGCTSLTSITLPNSVTSIKYGSFSGCTSLTSITLPDSVTSIGASCFARSGIVSIEIPDLVTRVGNYCFADCKDLISIKFLNSLKTLESEILRNCTSLKNVTLPNSISSFEKACFSGCTSLTSITLPDSVTSIGSDCFYNCVSLISIACLSIAAPKISSSPFGGSSSTYVGHNTYDKGTNTLYVPTGATGYDSGYWLDPLQNSEKCGFTISYTL